MRVPSLAPASVPPASGHRLAPDHDSVDATLWALLPWLGIPYLLSAELARAGHALDGRVLPVVAFLPLIGIAYLAALAAPKRLRISIVGGAGAVSLGVLLTRLVLQSDHDAGKLVLAVAAAATLAVVAATFAAGRLWKPWLAAPLTLALLLCQSLDGWQTYLAVGNPFGWLEEPVREQVHVSAFILEHAPIFYPVLKVGLALAVAAALRKTQAPGLRFSLALAVSYVGLQPALFSAANLLAT